MKIQVAGVSKRYQTKKEQVLAVDNIDWEASEGSVYGIIGPNGSGKSTMIRMLLDLIRPDTGTISIDGIASGNRGKKFKQSLGYLPEQRGLYKDEKAVDLLSYLARLKGVPAGKARKQALEMLTEVGLTDSLDKPMKSYSKGMSQKVQLIAALQHSPRLAILDEPFAGLDPVNVRLVREFIQRQRTDGAIVILCTHMMNEAERLADHIFMFHEGKIVRKGPQIALRKAYGRNKVMISPFPKDVITQSATVLNRTHSGAELQLNPDIQINQFLAEVSSLGLELSSLTITPPSLEDIFVEAVNELR